MSLSQHLKIGTPLIWVVSDEPHRVIETTLAQATRPVFRLDPLDGLVAYRPDDDMPQWRQHLVADDDGNPIVTHNLQVAASTVLAERGILIVEHAHFSVEHLIPFYGAISQRYLQAVRADSATQLPPQFLLISCKDEVPPEIARDTFKVFAELPDAAELTKIVQRLLPSSTVPALDAVVRAGQGLSEVEFINACARSFDTHRALDPEYINHLKIETIRSGGLLDIRTPRLTVDDVGGLDRLKQLLEFTAWTWRHPDKARELNIEPLRRILLVGVPGAGKSAMAEASASLLGLDLAKTGASQTMNKFVGESEANMRRLFAQVRAMEPIVLWIDEFGRDMSGSQSSGAVDGGTTDRVHGEFLTGLQELPDQVFLMAAANRIETLPPEMLRADRFDKIIFVGLPSLAEREAIFRIHLGAHAERYDLQELARVTPYFTGAEIKQLVKQVRFHAAAHAHRAPTLDEFVEFAPEMKGRVWKNHHDAVIEMYTRAVNEWDWASSEQEAEASRVLNAQASASVQAPTKPAVMTGSRAAGI